VILDEELASTHECRFLVVTAAVEPPVVKATFTACYAVKVAFTKRRPNLTSGSCR
jgi:hypothetical protein